MGAICGKSGKEGPKAVQPKNGGGQAQKINEQPEEYKFKLLIVGDPAVGKTALLLRFTDATFSEDSVNTLGTEFKEKELATDDWKAKFQVWDTAGQEKFRTITSSYYRGAQGVLIVFDVAKRETWEHVAKWLEQVDKYSSEGIQKVIVANKTDLEVEVDLDEVKSFAADKGIDYIETSAKSGENVEKMFESIGTLIKKYMDDN